MVPATLLIAVAWWAELVLVVHLHQITRRMDVGGFVSPPHLAATVVGMVAVPVVAMSLAIGLCISAAASDGGTGWRMTSLRTGVWTAFLAPCWWSPVLFLAGWSSQSFRPVPGHGTDVASQPSGQVAWNILGSSWGFTLSMIATWFVLATAVRSAARPAQVDWQAPRANFFLAVMWMVVGIVAVAAACGLIQARELVTATIPPNGSGSAVGVLPLTPGVVLSVLGGSACAALLFGAAGRMLVRSAIPARPAAPGVTLAPTLKRPWDAAAQDGAILVVPERHTASVILMPGQTAGWWVQVVGNGALGIPEVNSRGGDVQLRIVTATGIPGVLEPVPSYPNAYQLEPPVPGWWHLTGTNRSDFSITLTVELDMPPGSAVRPDSIAGRAA